MAVFAGLLLLLGIAGLIVSIVLIGVRVFAKKGWGYKRSLFLAGASVIVMIVATVVGVSATPAGKEGYEAGKQAAKNPSSQTQDVLPAADVKNSGPAKQVQQEPVKQEQTTQTRDQVSVDQGATAKLKQYMYENFGGNGNPRYKTSWYDLIKEIKVYSDGSEKWAEIKTDIYRDDEGKRVAATIARAILAEGTVGRVEVDDKDGFPLAQELR